MTNAKFQVVLWGDIISEHDTYVKAILDAEKWARETGCPYEVKEIETVTLKYKHIAIDYDGTIADDNTYPLLGAFKEHAVHVMKRILSEGGEIAVWTCRNGEHQEQQITAQLKDAGIHSFKFNQPFDHFTNEYGGDNSRKIFADVYIDDRALGAVIDWYEIEKQLFGEI